ncbi:MAG: hypothetical protein JXA60_08675 [Candidatus Coatesbacteria bacterium]|nr:hypothetical protein [Candidatus Coatesbacteria bacterium]
MKQSSFASMRDYLSQLKIDGLRIKERFDEYKFLSERLKNRFYYRRNLNEDIYQKLVTYYQLIINICDFISWHKQEQELSPQDFLKKLRSYYNEICSMSKSFWQAISDIELDNPRTYYISLLGRIMNDLDLVMQVLEAYIYQKDSKSSLAF